MMAGEAGDFLIAPEVVAIDQRDHLDHPARGSLHGKRVGCKVGSVGAGARMAIRAVKAESGRHDSHRCEKVIDGEFFQRPTGHILKVFARLPVRGRRLRLTLSRNDVHENETTPYKCQESDHEGQPPPEFHIGFPPEE